jgi:hypothetical protein
MTPKPSDDDPFEDSEAGGIRRGRREDPDAVAARIQAIIDAAQDAAAGILKDAEVQARKRIDGSKERAEKVASERVEDIYAVTDALVEQARKVRERSGELVKALDDAIRHVDGSEPEAPPARPEPRAPSEPGQPAPGSPGAPDAPEAPEAPEAPRLRERVSSSLRAERERLDEMMDKVTETTERFAAKASRAPAADAPAPEPEPEPRPAPEEPAPEEPRPRAYRPPPKDVPREARLLATRMAVAGSSRDQISDKLRSEHGIEDADALLDEILGPA